MPGSASKSGATRIAAVILAGGQGRRMGGVDKGLIEYQGRPLIEWALAALVPQVDELVISANRNLDTYAAYGHRVLPDTLPDFPGPLAGVLAALQAVNADWLVVTPCDTPHLPADLVTRLLSAAQREQAVLAVAADAERSHHSCFIVRTDQRDGLAAYLAEGERAVRHWQARLPSTTVMFDAAGFVNFNQPQDLQSRHAGKSRGPVA
jgi:molybdopterin-guanine dinucleotide biosynthesis protein A